MQRPPSRLRLGSDDNRLGLWLALARSEARRLCGRLYARCDRCRRIGAGLSSSQDRARRCSGNPLAFGLKSPGSANRIGRRDAKRILQ